VELALCCLSLGSFVLQTFFEAMPREAKKHEKEEISRSTDIVNIYICALSCCGSFGIASVLQQFCVTSTCCILSSSFIGGTSVLEFLQPFFLVTARPTVAQSQRSSSTLNLWVPPDFRLFGGLFEDENGQEFFVLT